MLFIVIFPILVMISHLNKGTMIFGDIRESQDTMQMIDVTNRQAERFDLREFAIGWFGGYQMSEFHEGGIH